MPCRRVTVTPRRDTADKGPVSNGANSKSESNHSLGVAWARGAAGEGGVARSRRQYLFGLFVRMLRPCLNGKPDSLCCATLPIPYKQQPNRSDRQTEPT